MGERTGEVRVRLKRGAWEIEISCSEHQVQQAVESVLAGLRSTSPELAKIAEPPSGKGAATCRNLIVELWKEGWFAIEKSLSEVYDELARRGYHYDKTAVSHTLTDLVRENFLARTGAIRNYRYVQKKPPESVPEH